ncbi:hypothetical protein [Coxiella endosymbiont of Ornithodoros maritimus]|uniref:hypothetical protein n=1 Tax=Coxiella endosymbiont of Ornithodoros maritimus TaxID=1656172 RepID=UPI0022650CB3|nr:hypothetical protein [Coxiella endosymbiont of Ornithodoros maritimus]
MRNDTNNSNSKVEVEGKSVKSTLVDNRESEVFPLMKFRMDNLVGLFNLEDKLGIGGGERGPYQGKKMKMVSLF